MHGDDRKCLSEQELGAYIEDRLSPETKEAFERHLAACSKCWSEFVAISRVMVREDIASGDVPEHLIRKAVGLFPEKESVFDVILDLLRDAVKVIYSAVDIQVFTPQPALGLRGGEKPGPGMVVLKKSFDDIDVELDIEKVQGSLCSIRVAVDDSRGKVPVNNLRVELFCNEKELASHFLDDSETVLEDIGKGKYTIKINQKGRVLGEIALNIK